jgi:hypothetical protein
MTLGLSAATVQGMLDVVDLSYATRVAEYVAEKDWMVRRDPSFVVDVQAVQREIERRWRAAELDDWPDLDGVT